MLFRSLAVGRHGRVLRNIQLGSTRTPRSQRARVGTRGSSSRLVEGHAKTERKRRREQSRGRLARRQAGRGKLSGCGPMWRRRPAALRWGPFWKRAKREQSRKACRRESRLLRQRGRHAIRVDAELNREVHGRAPVAQRMGQKRRQQVANGPT